MGCAIDTKSDFEQFSPFLTLSEFVNIQNFLVRVDLDGGTIPHLSQRHLIHGKCSCFIRANIVGSSHGLTGLHLSN